MAQPDKNVGSSSKVLTISSKHIVAADFHLEPFDPKEHATAYWEGTRSSPELYSFIRFGPCVSKEDFVRQFTNENAMRPGCMLYAILTTRKAKTDSSLHVQTEENLAGIAGFQDASHVNLSIEIGPMLLLPEFQGLGLATDVTKLMTQHALRDTSLGGLGLRRVVWMANTANAASIKVAEKAGFQHEALLRWHVCFHNGQALGKIGNGKPLPPGANPGDIGRDSVILSRCWDDQ